jgi:hypothetical protein
MLEIIYPWFILFGQINRGDSAKSKGFVSPAVCLAAF